MDRRSFLQLGLTGFLLGPGRVLATPQGDSRLLSCYSDQANNHFFGMTDLQGRQLMNIPLPARGHGTCLDQEQQYAAVFARRPGDFVWIIDLRTRQVVQKITAAKGRHFYGHGVFTPTGQLLCSENAFESGQGVIGIYEADQHFNRVGEFPSGGIGPHEIRLLSNRQTLVVANGGIRTHPDLPRVKQNLSAMQPNLAYLDAGSGELLQKHEPPAQWHQLSIRHIAVSPDDRVAIAMQYEGLPYKQPPLIALHQGEQELNMLSAPAEVQSRLKNYCGSVEFSADGSRFAVSSPRGGLITLWSAEGQYLAHHRQADVCGLSALPTATGGFIASDGHGSLTSITHTHEAVGVWRQPQLRWDNHMQLIL